jgi:hypothetical protein
VATGTLVLALHNLAGRVGLDRLFTSSFTYYASRSLNVVPARHVRAQDCDVLFAHEYFPLNLDAETIPIIYETQLLPETQLAAYGQGPGSRERELRLKRLCAARATVVCVRDPTAAGLARSLVVPSTVPVHVTPWYLPYLEPAAEPLAKHAGSGGECRMLFVGNDARRKGLPALLEALARLEPHTRRAVSLTVVSRFLDGPVAVDGRLARVLTDLPQAEVLRLMREAHVFVLPTHGDTFGMVLLEALAQGCAVVSSAQEPQSWILDGGRAGRLVPSGDVEGLARALSDLATPRSERHALARAGHERFLSRFHHREVARLYRSAFEEARDIAPCRRPRTRASC